jgi:hypothetical protein
MIAPQSVEATAVQKRAPNKGAGSTKKTGDRDRIVMVMNTQSNGIADY